MDRKAVESMSMGELAKLHNELRPDAKVKKFSDRKTGIRRVLAALEEAGKGAAPPAAPAAAAKAEMAPSGPPSPRKQRATQYVLSGATKAPRPGTKRAELLAALLGDGMSVAEMQAKFEWKLNDCKDALSLLAKQNGYATYLGDDGRWHAAEQEKDAKAKK